MFNVECWTFTPFIMNFSLLHPTLHRADQCVDTVERWLRLATSIDSLEYLIGIEPSDTATLDAVRALSAHFPCVRGIILAADNSGYVRSCNTLGAVSTGRVIIMVEDDMHPCLHWDTKLWRELTADLSAHRELVLFIPNHWDPQSRYGHQVLTRARYEKQGHIFHPGYWSMYADDDLYEQACRDGVFRRCQSFQWEHRHPGILQGKVEWDDTYRRENATVHYNNGKALFQQRNPPPWLHK